MEREDRLSITDKLLLAAYELEENGQRPFSAEALVVAAWRKFPDAFGLAGYNDEGGRPAYPDSNRVFAEIMGSKPIRKKGLLRKMGSKMYELTEAGRESARVLLRSSDDAGSEKLSLAREVKRLLRRLLATKAVKKVREHRTAEMSFYDACEFWQISPRSSAMEFDGRLGNFERIVEDVRTAMRDKAVAFEHGGEAFGPKELDLLLDVDRELRSRFSEEIDVIRRRTDERE